MIKINLASKKRAVNAATGRGLDSLRLDSFRLDSGQMQNLLGQLKELPLKKLAISIGLGVAATIILDGYKDDMMKAEQAEYDKIIALKPKLEAESSKMKGLQELQKSMESDEKRIRTKLDTIKKLIAGRSSAALVLEELAKLTPPTVWLSDFSLKGNDLSFKGASTDFGNVSEFTKMIQSSSMFSDMALKDTQLTLDDHKRQVASFSVTAKKR